MSAQGVDRSSGSRGGCQRRGGMARAAWPASMEARRSVAARVRAEKASGGSVVNIYDAVASATIGLGECGRPRCSEHGIG